MDKKRINYEKPELFFLEVRVEGGIAASPLFGPDGETGIINYDDGNHYFI